MPTRTSSAPGRPLYATERDMSRPTCGARVAVIANATGTPLMPWQQYAADVGTELLPDGSFAYEVVIVTVPRQSGKTTLIRSICVERCISMPGAEVFYTAQKGKDARARFNDLVKALRGSPLASQIKVRASQGSEAIELPNGSAFRTFAPVMDALHGYTPPLVVIDEAMAFDEAEGDMLMGAIIPAQQTIARRQLWIISTAGTARSTFLRKMIDRGRAGDPDVCLVEYAAPDDADPYDEATWRRYHPAVDFVRPDGSPQVTVDDIRKAANTLPRSEFERGYLNRWTVTSSQLIAEDEWRNLGDPQLAAAASDVVLVYDVTHDRSAASIVAVWRDERDRLAVRLVMADVGLSWVAPAVLDLVGRTRPLAVAARDAGPARIVTDQLTRQGLDVQTTSPKDWQTGTGLVLSAIRDGALVHDGSTQLAAAAAGIVAQPTGDGLAFSSRHSQGDVSSLTAATAGAWIVDRPRARASKPRVYVGKAS